MNTKTVIHVIESLKERMEKSAERKAASPIVGTQLYHQGRIDALSFAIDLLKLWGGVK